MARSRGGRTAPGRIDRYLLDALPHLGVRRADDLFCKPLTGRCAGSLNGRPLHSDDDHLSPVGVSLVADLIAREMGARGWLGPTTATGKDD